MQGQGSGPPLSNKSIRVVLGLLDVEYGCMGADQRYSEDLAHWSLVWNSWRSTILSRGPWSGHSACAGKWEGR